MLDILISFDWFGDDEIIQTKDVQNHFILHKKSQKRTPNGVRKYNVPFNLHIQGKTTFLPLTYQRYDTAETGVFNQRGRQQCSTQAAQKQAETRRGGVRWWELAIGLAVASGGERERGKED